MVLKGYPRISETFISNEILLLEEIGFRIHLFSMRRPRENFSHASVTRIRAAVDYLPESLLRPLPRLLYCNTRLAANIPDRYLAALKVAVRRFSRTRKAATFKHLLQAGYLVQRLLPGKNVVHLHAHFAHSPASVAMFAGLLSGLDFSFTAHAKDIYTSDPIQLREKLALARFVVTCTDYNRTNLQALAGTRSAAVHRVYHGVDTGLFAASRDSCGDRGQNRLLTVARLTAKKGIPTVLKALALLRDRGLRIEHTLIGDGEERAKILKLADRLGLQGTTRWLGTLPHEVVLQHYRRADVFVLGCEVAANGDRDGIPNVLLESMAMGVPVVATSISAIPELVESGTTGLLVPPGEPEKLADALARMLSDRPLRQKVIENGMQKVRQHFDNRVLIKDLAAIYRQSVPALYLESPVAEPSGCGSKRGSS
jgi:glycosyltransferase involved in cell wall biosynthesis